MAKISVIIPVYNVEKTLHQCLDSVIQQTYKNLEIICVNDASTDSSAEILEEYLQKDNRIIIVNNEKNLGLGLTRNHGLEYAAGEYIHFLDSDDWMELNAYEVLSQNLTKSPDVVYFLWNSFDIRHNKIIPPKPISENVSDRADVIKKTGINAWHGIFKKEFLTKNFLLFNDYRCMEDIEFTYKVLILTDKIKILNKPLLNYRTNNPNSLIGNFHKYPDCAINSYNTIYEFSKKLTENERDSILALLLNSVLYRLTGSFVTNELSYHELKNFTANIDLTVFKNDLKSYNWYNLYNEINTLLPFMIKLSYKAKKILKENFYILYEFLKDIKN